MFILTSTKFTIQKKKYLHNTATDKILLLSECFHFGVSLQPPLLLLLKKGKKEYEVKPANFDEGSNIWGQFCQRSDSTLTL